MAKGARSDVGSALDPGGYHLVDFGQFVDDMKAFDEAGKPLEVTEAEDPVHWTVKPGDAKKIKIRYSANHAFDGMLTAKSMDVEANHLGDAYAYLNSASLFALIPGQLERRALVKMNPPRIGKWRRRSRRPPMVGIRRRATTASRTRRS